MVQEYRRLRHQRSAIIGPVRASHAILEARAEVALREAEAAGRIRFRWVPDEVYMTDGSYAYETERESKAAEELERRKLQSGEWEALGVIAQVPKVCESCGTWTDEWEDRGSVWSIVIDTDDEFGYRRRVERDLATDAGVI